MNAAAYLTKQGWRGQGHSLDLTNRGLSKPLLLAHKFDNNGLGKKKADTDFSNQWWLNAWSSPATPAQSGDSTPITPATGLYSHFVKGQILESTFDMAKREIEAAEAERSASKKRKHEDEPTAIEATNGHAEASSETKPRKKSKNGSEPKKARKQKKTSEDIDEQVDAPKAMAKVVADEQPPRRPDGPAHPESIAALKDAGEKVMLPLMPFLPKDSKDPFYRAYEAARKESSAKGGSRLVLGTVREYMTENAGFGPGELETSKSYKGDKIERERLKREAKREHSHWLTVFQQPWLYRPDGTPIDGSAVDVEHTKKKKKVKTEKKKEPVDYAKLHEEKKARRAAKDERRAEMRAIKKKNRAEKKLRNQEKQVELRKIAQERKKEVQRLADVQEAAKQGMSYEDFVNHRLEETLQKQVSKNAAKKAKAEARAAIAKTRQEQMLKDTAELNGDVPSPVTNGASSAAPKIAPAKKAGGSARKGSDFISLDAGASSDDDSEDSDEESDSDSDDSSDDASDDGVSLPAAATSSAAAEPLTEGLGFVIDTVGNNPNNNAAAAFPARTAVPKKKVKDMTKEERKARLEGMRARREERRARQGKDPLTKKARKQSRAERKEKMINKLTSEILIKKRRLQPDVNAPEVQAMSKKEQKAQPAEAKGWTREDWKSAKREARRFQRAVKAGKVPENEVPLGWTGTVRKEPKKKGAGGKDPQRPFWHEWTMGGERIDLRGA